MRVRVNGCFSLYWLRLAPTKEKQMIECLQSFSSVLDIFLE